MKDFTSIQFNDEDDNGVKYTKTIHYLSDSARISMDTLVTLLNGSKAAFAVYVAILYKLANNTNIVKITRKELKTALNLSDSSISTGIKELVSKQLIEERERDKYHIPLKTAYKGNLDKMLSLYNRDCDEFNKRKEEEQRASINLLSLKRKAKLNKDKDTNIN